MNPCLHFKNVFDQGTVTAGSTASGFPATNVADWRMATPYRWKATGSGTQYIQVDLGASLTMNADTVSIAGHNLKTGAYSLAVKYGAGYSSTALTATVVPSDRPWIKTFTAPGAQRYWKVELTSGSTTPQIGILVLGLRLELPLGPQPGWDLWGEEAVTDYVTNEYGMPLGSNLKYLSKRMTIDYPDGFSDSELWTASGISWDTDFLPHSRSKPFFFAWDTATDTEPWLCRRDGFMSNPISFIKTRRTLSMPVVAYREP